MRDDRMELRRRRRVFSPGVVALAPASAPIWASPGEGVTVSMCRCLQSKERADPCPPLGALPRRPYHVPGSRSPETCLRNSYARYAQGHLLWRSDIGRRLARVCRATRTTTRTIEAIVRYSA